MEAEALAPIHGRIRMRRRIRDGLMYLACIFALSWPAFVNGQAFYFPDTTSYVRAADLAMYVVSHGRISTAWTRRDEAHVVDSAAPPAAAPDTQTMPGAPRHGNDISAGNVMAGRSPYFGMLLWLGWVSSRFWLFVLLNAAVTAGLIRIALAGFGVRARECFVASCLGLGLLSSAAFTDAFLMPDVLAGQGILAFLALALHQGRMSRWVFGFLAAVIVVSVVSHGTHEILIALLTGLLALLALLRVLPWARIRPALLLGIAAVFLGGASMSVTSIAVRHVLGAPPQLVPLLTARLLADGPGATYLREHCATQQFAVCRYADHPPASATAWLWSTSPEDGAYLLADPALRSRLAAEDQPFALAVARAYPLAVARAMIANTALQASLIGVDWVNIDCDDRATCWSSVPDAERVRLLQSMSGRQAWPLAWIKPIHAGVVLASCAALALGLVLARRRKLAMRREMWVWVVLLLCALLANAALGGAVSEPQSRYQSRVIWLLPFTALMIGLSLWAPRRQGTSAGPTGREQI